MHRPGSKLYALAKPMMSGAASWSATGSRLCRSRPRTLDTGELEFTNPIVLVRPPFHVSFAFAGRDRIWQETWHDAAQLPNAVRVTVRNAMTDQILPVSTATLLNVNAPAECVARHGNRLRRPKWRSGDSKLDPGRPSPGRPSRAGTAAPVSRAAPSALAANSCKVFWPDFPRGCRFAARKYGKVKLKSLLCLDGT